MRMFLLIFIFFLFTASLKAQWINIGPIDTSGYLVIFSLTGTGSYVFTTSYNRGLFISSNNGLNWSHIETNFTPYSLAVSGNDLYSSGTGVYKSTNLGQSWVQLFSHANGVFRIAINGNTICAGTGDSGLYISSNSGQNWIHTSLNIMNVRAIAVNGNNIYAGGDYHLYLSTDLGNNWNDILIINNYSIGSIALNGNNVYAGSMGLYRSTNNGLNWGVPVLNNQSINCIALSGQNVFAGTPAKVYFSWNMGDNWTQLNDGMYNCTITSLYISTDYVFAGSGSYSIFRRPLSDFTGIKSINNSFPDKFSLSQNYPNPFNPVTTIKYQLPITNYVKLVLFDILGREVATLVNEKQSPGTYEVEWDGRNYSSGVYFYKLTVDNASAGAKDATGPLSITRKMVLMK